MDCDESCFLLYLYWSWDLYCIHIRIFIYMVDMSLGFWDTVGFRKDLLEVALSWLQMLHFSWYLRWTDYRNQ